MPDLFYLSRCVFGIMERDAADHEIPNLEKPGFAAFGQAVAAGAAGQGIAGGIGEVHAAEGAVQAVAEGLARATPLQNLIADPNEKNPGEDDEQAGKNEPGEFERDHRATGARTSAPQWKATSPQTLSPGAGWKRNVTSSDRAFASSWALPDARCGTM